MTLKNAIAKEELRQISERQTVGFSCDEIYRIFSNLIRTLFYSFRGLKKIRCGLESRAD